MQIFEAGPPMYSNLYKYERANKYLKNLVKNKSSPVASMVKNYLIAELSTLSLANNFEDVWKINNIFRYTDEMTLMNLIPGLNALSRLKYDVTTKKLRCEFQNFLDNEEKPKDLSLTTPNESLQAFANLRMSFKKVRSDTAGTMLTKETSRKGVEICNGE
jgi:hypothetical protein